MESLSCAWIGKVVHDLWSEAVLIDFFIQKHADGILA